MAKNALNIFLVVSYCNSKLYIINRAAATTRVELAAASGKCSLTILIKWDRSGFCPGA